MHAVLADGKVVDVYDSAEEAVETVEQWNHGLREVVFTTAPVQP